MKSSLDKLWIGLTLGILAPIISVLIFYMSTYGHLPFMEFIEIITQANIYVQLLSVCIVPNLLIFFIFIWTNKLTSAKGVLFATFLYAFIVFGLKFFT